MTAGGSSRNKTGDPVPVSTLRVNWFLIPFAFNANIEDIAFNNHIDSCERMSINIGQSHRLFFFVKHNSKSTEAASQQTLSIVDRNQRRHEHQKIAPLRYSSQYHDDVTEMPSVRLIRSWPVNCRTVSINNFDVQFAAASRWGLNLRAIIRCWSLLGSRIAAGGWSILWLDHRFYFSWLNFPDKILWVFWLYVPWTYAYSECITQYYF